MSKISVDQMLLKAKIHLKNGERVRAQELYEKILQAYPRNKRAHQGLALLKKTSIKSTTPSPPNQIIKQLIQLFESGQINLLITKAKTVLNQYPDAFVIWNILGVAYKKSHKLLDAEMAFQKVIKLEPQFAEGYNNYGVTLQALRKFDAALKSYKTAVQLKPTYVEAHNNMGNTFRAQNKLYDAIKSYEAALALRSDYAQAHNNLGHALYEIGKKEDALQSLKRALQIEPDYLDALNNIGNIYLEQGNFDDAASSYRAALSIDPVDLELLNNFGNALQAQGNFFDALDVYEKALSIDSKYAPSYNNMGNALRHVGNLDDALSSFKKALAIRSDYSDAHNNMGNTLKDKGNYDAAIASYKTALSLTSDDIEIYNNIGNAFLAKGDLDNALAYYEKALLIRPDCSETRYNMSFLFNIRGKFKLGMEYYETRMSKKIPIVRPPSEGLVWDGAEELVGKRFHVYEEQGLGDIIQFCRFLPILRDRGANVIFNVAGKLHRILQTLDSDIHLTSERPCDDEIDFEAPLMSLPYLLKADLDTLPNFQSYLHAEPEKVAKWNKTFRKNSFKVGICWQGSSSKIDFERSFSLNLFKDISELSNLELISLHKGEGENQIQSLNFGLTTLGEMFDNDNSAFVDTAAVISNCQLVITSDTSVAHLAGALGCPTWVVLKQIPDWRWMLHRIDSPWYPKMVLYRQTERGDWESVFKKIKDDLSTLIKNWDE